MYTIKETTLSNMVEQTKTSWIYKLLSYVHTQSANSYIQTLTTQASVIAAYAQPSTNTVYVRTDIALSSLVKEQLINHEIGHILDYNKRGKIRFYCTAYVSYIQKIKIMKKMQHVYSIEQLNQLTLDYHNTTIERHANTLGNVDPHIFCITEEQLEAMD